MVVVSVAVCCFLHSYNRRRLSTSTMSTTNKRTKTDGAEPQGDKCIGLEFTDGRVAYCHRSTLTNAGGYFAARFGGGNIPAGEERQDEHGRSIYFLERDGELFVHHVLPYLVTTNANLPPFSKKPDLWRKLRREADFYLLEGLSDMLFVTHSCHFQENNDNKGVLYWLGTDKGTKEEYRNPHAIGAIRVGGWVDWTTKHLLARLSPAIELNELFPPLARTGSSRRALVEYRPPIEDSVDRVSLNACNTCYNLWCQFGYHLIPADIDLLSIKLHLTAYSLRSDRCGMTDWKLEASTDRVEWTVLHEAHNVKAMKGPSEAQLDALRALIDSQEDLSENERAEILLDCAERDHRCTFLIRNNEESPTFYRYVRIIGPGPANLSPEASSCLHGVGLELYGDVHED